MIAVSSSGKSFRALAAYLASGRTGEERDRVAWSIARNLPTDNPELAATFMRATAAQSAKVQKPVYHVVLSFAPADMPNRAAMERVANKVLTRLGLAEHQAVIVAHRDRNHAHVHILVNRVHPELGRAWERWKDQPIIQQVLREEEQALGLRTVQGSLTLDGTLDRPESARSAARSKAPAGDTRARSARRESGSDQVLTEIADALDRHERLIGLKQDVQLTRSDIDAVHARLTRLELTHARAAAADEEFRGSLRRAYRDVDAAHSSFMKRASEFGPAHVAKTMSERPEEFGTLLQTERRILGLRTVQNDHDARLHARAAARAGEQAVTTEAQMWVAASEARVRRLDETFVSQLRTVFVDSNAAKAVFADIAARDGLETAVATLRTAPERLAVIRSTEGAGTTVRQSVLDRVATTGAEATVARHELERRPAAPVPQTQVAARLHIATSELLATREHGTALANRERSVREALSAMPRRSELEHRIGQLADRLLPHEMRQLKRMVTAPRLAVLAKIRSTIRDAMLARDERSA
jgi:hypothetical protein